MPSPQHPPVGSTAVDPTALRSDLGDARVLRIVPAELRATLEGLRAEGFAFLADLGGADYPGRTPRFDVVYHLVKLSPTARDPAAVGRPERVRVLCGVEEAAPVVPSIADLWPAADWAEREVFDLFGIRFDGHPDLRRIQMPADWVGHPLRKDYPLRGPAQERSPRPSFALKSNVAAGTPAAGRTAAALQRQIARARAATTEGNGQTAEPAQPDTARGGQTLKDNTQ